LGGQLHLAAAPPGRQEFARLANDLETQLKVRDVKIVLNYDADSSLIEKEKPDAVILATGARPITPAIPGSNLPHVVQAWEVLADNIRTGRRVVIIGGGAVGVETALFLAEKGTLSGDALKFLFVNKAETVEDLYAMATRGTKNILLIEMIDSIGKDIGKTTRWGMLQNMSRSGVETRTATRALEITETGVKIETGGEETEIPADTVVLGVGNVSHNPLQEMLEKSGIPYKIAGDAGQIGKAFDAVHQGFAAGRLV
jgi:2,4-dienoyl-CoA reductase (NADPH2)